MMRSLYSGVAGLKTHQIKMDVIGNNIANVNTVAYKSQSITFAELMYQTTQSASGPNAETGRAGVNAKQIGLGVQSAAISTAISQQGSSQNTGNAFDLRISGDAFFVVNGGAGNKFTRDGSFYVDAAGNLAMSSNGYNVMGWQVDKNGDIVQDNVSALKILAPANMTSEPQVTSRANMSGIIDKMDPQVLGDGKVVNLQIYDNLGYSYTARFSVTDTDVEGEYALILEDLRDANNDSVLYDELDEKGNVIREGKYNAYIFSGDAMSDAGQAQVIKRARSYSLAGAYTVNQADGTLSYTDTTVNPPATKTIAYPPTDLGEQEIYAKAFGFSDYTELQNQRFYPLGTDGKPDYTKDPVNYGTMLTTDDMRAYYLDAAGATLKVSGYSAPYGNNLILRYNNASGAFVSVKDGSGTSTERFFLNIVPRGEKQADGTYADDKDAENPFSMQNAQGDDKGMPGIQVFMNDTTNLNNEKKSTIGAVSGDHDGFGTGWAVGTMTGVSIQNDGRIYGAYDNGQTKLLGQIAFAKFANASGLEKEGDNLYSATLNSGEFDGIGVDVAADGGKVSTGILEMSNVDLSTEFTELITTQRGFQANSRIITVSDTLLEELVNLKR